MRSASERAGRLGREGDPPKGADVTDVSTVFAPGSDQRALEVVLTNRGADVAARVLDGSGQPRTDATIVLFPTDRSRWMGTVTMPYQQTVKNDRIQAGLQRPGEYFVAAIGPEDAARLATMGVRGFELLAKVASTITLAESERRTLDLKLANLGGLW